MNELKPKGSMILISETTDTWYHVNKFYYLYKVENGKLKQYFASDIKHVLGDCNHCLPIKKELLETTP